MTPAIIGGVLLIIGACFVFVGDIFKSVFVYFLADIIWIFLALQAGDIVGAVTVTIGGILGLLAFLKMYRGEYNKTIRKD